MGTLLKIGNFCEKIILVFGGICLAFIPLSIIIQIVFRSFGVSVNWSEEAARFAFVAVTFLGSILCIRHGKHITITFLFDKLPSVGKRVLGMILHLSMALFMAFCSYGATLIMAAARGVPANTMMWFQMNYLFGLVFVCCVIMVFVCLLRAIAFILGKVEFTEDGMGGTK